MDYLQYKILSLFIENIFYEVLNLVINGLPSIPPSSSFPFISTFLRFKPCYKWITFNTLTEGIDAVFMVERSHFYMVAKIIHFSVF